MHFNALIFDFDGTIADTLSEGLRLYNQLATEHRFNPIQPDELPALRHLSSRQILRHLGIPKRKVPSLLAKGRSLLKARIRDLPLIAGMSEVLPRLRSQAECFGILTSNSVENVESFLDAHGIRDLFTFVSSTPRLSGKSKHLRSIARTFSLQPLQMLYIGDEIRDVRAAHKAGLAAAAVTWGFNSAESLAALRPRFLARHPSDLLALTGIPNP